MPYKDLDRQREYLKVWWETNKDNCREARKKTKVKCRERNKKYILKLKSNGCVLCGWNDEKQRLHFHHINPSEKHGNIHLCVRDMWAIKRINEEVSKCILVCDKCHTLIHQRFL